MAGRKGKKAGSKKGKLVRVDFRRNRTAPARDKGWTRAYQVHQFEDQSPQTHESLMPKGDISRKRTIVDGTPVDLCEGLVIAMRGLFADVHDGRQVWSCTTRRVLRTRVIKERHPVTVGDRVLFDLPQETVGVEVTGVIHDVQPRRTQLTRGDGRRVQVIAANLDRVLIVASVREPRLKAHLVDRYLVAAHAGRIDPVVVLNKIDLDAEAAEAAAELYRGIGYPVILASIVTGAGIPELRGALTGRMSVIVGQSGVGKSSLLNAVQPGLELATGEVSQTNEKGRHTTTQSRLLALDLGAWVADTPGIRSYELCQVDRAELEKHFIDLAPYVPDCKFADCTHIHEDDCAVKAAVEDGAIHEQRYESYVQMFVEG